MAKSKVTICPYCGETQPAGQQCRTCGGLFEPLSRRATHNAMGPWFIRDPDRPFQPGCSYDTLVRMIQRGQVTKLTIVRGPTTRQFWTIARHAPGVAHLLGYCHQCDAQVDADDHGCHACGARFGSVVDRNYLGLPELRPLPWESQPHAAPETSAMSASRRATRGAADLDESSAGGRLSSFATDEELLTPDDVDDQAWGGPEPGRAAQSDDPTPASTAQRPQPAATAEPAHPAVAVADPASESLSAPASATAPAAQPASAAADDDMSLRLVRRRVLQLQTATQRLWIALAISVTLNLAFASVLLFNRPDAPPAGSTANDSAPAESAPVESADARASAADDAPVLDESAAPPAAQPPAQAQSTDSSPQSDAEPSAAVEPPPSPYEALLAEAGELIALGDDDTRELADRIADYEQAITRLRDVRDNAPADVVPTDIDQQIEQAERDLERLRLREFFP